MNKDMKRMKNWGLAATLTICGAMMLTSCTDAIGSMDNPVNPDPPYDPADELAKETFMHEDWMDRSVKPGDSFWDFALGGWFQTRADDDTGTWGQMEKIIKQKLDSHLNDYDSPVAGKLIKLLTQPAPEKSEEIKVINDFLATLKLDGDVSKADLFRNFGKLSDIGCYALVSTGCIPVGGRMTYILGPGVPYYYQEVNLSMTKLLGGLDDLDIEKAFKDEINFVLGDLMGLDIELPDVKAKADDIYKIQKTLTDMFYNITDTDVKTGQIQLKQMQAATLQSLNTRTRGNEGEDLKAVFNEAFHVDEAAYVVDEVDKVLTMLDEYSIDSWLLYMKYYVYARFSSLLRYTNHYDSESILYRIRLLVPSATIDYDLAMLMENSDPEGCREMLENMRRRMIERIGQLDWLSSATKAKAQEKMQAMVFSVGRPEHLFSDDFEITGSTAIEAGIQYMKQFNAYQRSIAGQPALGRAWDTFTCNAVYGSIFPVTTANAFYMAKCNELVILPAYIMPEVFPVDKDNAHRYAVSVAFGHELTHGFDPEGAEYDAKGVKINWWTAEDKANFKLLQQKMIARYNELEQLPGVKADGEKTLAENMADQGGVALAYDLWNEKLQADGLSGEQLRHQQRQFFVSDADVWRRYCTDETLASTLKTDVHSANHNRVNGIVRLFDDWYDLFGVKPGDKLYLAPADRVKIW